MEKRSAQTFDSHRTAIRLIEVDEDDFKFLYEMLQERDRSINISHNHMPSWDEHCLFVASDPYDFWWIIWDDDKRVGNCYLSARNEIGIFILKSCQGLGYGPLAIEACMEFSRRPYYLANISPLNLRSQRVFHRLGFEHIQNTYRIKTDG